MKSNIILALMLVLSACKSGPELPDPRASYPIPPAELMTPPQQMEPIPQ